MAKKVLILVGTKKGAFIIESDADRRSWNLRGPFCETWPMNHVIADAATDTIYGGGGNEWFGPAIWKSTDMGATWTHSSEGLAYQAGEAPITTPSIRRHIDVFVEGERARRCRHAWRPAWR
jgi:hypothetical protein